jgi:hypothetical protein
LQDTPKFTQSGIFGLKICHLATLFPSPKKGHHGFGGVFAQNMAV